MVEDNPLLQPWQGPLGTPPFDRVRADRFLPAFAAAIAEHEAEIALIRKNPAPPSFDTVLAPMERAGATLGRVRRLFWTLSSAEAEPGIHGIEAEVSALLTRHGTALAHDPAIFAKVAAVHAGMDAAGLSREQRRLTEAVHRGFLRGGAALDKAAKHRLAAIDDRLAALSVAFGQNVLAATAAWSVTIDSDALAGLPEPLCAAAAVRAEAAGSPGRYSFGADRGTMEAVLTFAADRSLREQVWRGFAQRCDGGAHDNRPLIVEMLALRTERARLLGYACHADYALADSMAATPDAAEALLMRVWTPAVARAEEEAAELQRLIDADGGGFALAAWDWRFYAEQVRRERFALDGAALKRQLRLEAVRDAAFGAAGRLYSLCFRQRADISGYHPDVEAWAVEDRQGCAVGVLYTDYLARPTKHGGAWMGSLRVQERMDGDVRPIVYMVANFARAPDPRDTPLSLDEARTLFHEFGHALHGLLSDVTYPSLSGTAVARDFVEFPSKFMEHWIIDAAVLRGFGVPEPLITAVGEAERYGQGFATVEFVGSALADMLLHRASRPIADPIGFVEEALAAWGMPEAIGMRHRLPVFTHVFDGGYASAYYSYLWSEVLDTDAYEAFVEAGDPFDPATATRFRDEILARGDSRDPMESFIAFRGRAPDETPLLRSRDLLPEAAE